MQKCRNVRPQPRSSRRDFGFTSPNNENGKKQKAHKVRRGRSQLNSEIELRNTRNTWSGNREDDKGMETKEFRKASERIPLSPFLCPQVRLLRKRRFLAIVVRNADVGWSSHFGVFRAIFRSRVSLVRSRSINTRMS